MGPNLRADNIKFPCRIFFLVGTLISLINSLTTSLFISDAQRGDKFTCGVYEAFSCTLHFHTLISVTNPLTPLPLISGAQGGPETIKLSCRIFFSYALISMRNPYTNHPAFYKWRPTLAEFTCIECQAPDIFLCFLMLILATNSLTAPPIIIGAQRGAEFIC